MKYKTTQPREVIRETVTKMTCDFCNEPVTDCGWDMNDIEIDAKIGAVYPETDTREGQVFDCCKNCWQDTVQPALLKLSSGRMQTYSVDEGRIASMPQV